MESTFFSPGASGQKKKNASIAACWEASSLQDQRLAVTPDVWDLYMMCDCKICAAGGHHLANSQEKKGKEREREKK